MEPSQPRVTVTPSVRAWAALAALIVLGWVVVTISGVIATCIVAAALATGLDPVVGRLERRGMGRGRATLIVFAGLVAALGVLLVITLAPLWAQFRDFLHALPGYLDTIAHKDGVRQWLGDTGTEQRMHDALAALARSVPGTATGILGVLGHLAGTAFSLVTLAFLTLFLLMGRPGIIATVTSVIPPATGARIEVVYAEIAETVSASLIGNLVISVIAATIVGLAAWAVGAPFPFVLAVLTGLFDLIPQIGSTIAAIIVGFVTLAGAGVLPCVVIIVVILIYQQLENYVIQPAVMREAVDLPAYATIMAVLVGSALLGIAGAILAVPLAASVRIVAGELSAPRRARMAAQRASAGAS